MKMKTAAIAFAVGLTMAGCQTTGAGAPVSGAYVPTPQEQAIQQAAIAQAGAAGAFNYNAAQAAAGGALANPAAAGLAGQGIAAALGATADAPIAASQPDDARKSCEQLAAEIAGMNEIVAEANSSATTSQVASVGIGLAKTFGGYFGGAGAVNALQAANTVDAATQQQQQAAQVRSQQAAVRLQVLGAISQGKGC